MEQLSLFRSRTDRERQELEKAAVQEAIDASEDTARQEFRDETTVDVILRRHGLNPQRMPSGEVDFTLNLQQAMFAVEESKRAFRRLPEAVRLKYPTPQALMEAFRAGEITSLEELTVPPPPPPPPADS